MGAKANHRSMPGWKGNLTRGVSGNVDQGGLTFRTFKKKPEIQIFE